MSAPAFTPGPWEVYRHPVANADEAKAELCFQVDNTDPLSDTLFLINASGKCPALTGCGPTSEANAYLIASAPDLYERLTSLTFECMACLQEHQLDENRTLGMALTHADAALAKARGES